MYLPTNATFPRLVVFGLDFVLWPFWVDRQISPPVQKMPKTGKVVDSDQNVLRYYDIVPKIFKRLRRERIRIGVVSVARSIAASKQLIYLFDWATLVSFAEIYPEHISQHFGKMQNVSDTPYEDMLYFDVADSHVYEASQLGIMSILVFEGITWDYLKDGIEEFQKKKIKEMGGNITRVVRAKTVSAR